MGYYIDLKSISIDNYKEILKTTELIPSWKVLEEDIDKNLDIIKKYNELKDKIKIYETIINGLSMQSKQIQDIIVAIGVREKIKMGIDR